MPAGRVAAELDFAAIGRSASALIGAMSGSGSATLENAHINGVDPNIFQVVDDAGDASQLSQPLRLKAFVDPLLIGGTMVVASAELPMTLKDGQLRIAATRLNGNSVQLVVAGGYDFASDQIDLRAILSPTSTAMNVGGVHPEIQILVGGTPDALSRTPDLSALSAWLTLRAVDRETKRLEAIERNTQANRAPDAAPATAPSASVPRPVTPAPPATAPPAQAPQASSAPPASPNAAVPPLPPLPPPVEIRPAPQARPQQPKARLPLALTPGTQ
jgi:large subunit ribosomal protein L24